MHICTVCIHYLHAETHSEIGRDSNDLNDAGKCYRQRCGRCWKCIHMFTQRPTRRGRQQKQQQRIQENSLLTSNNSKFLLVFLFGLPRLYPSAPIPTRQNIFHSKIVYIRRAYFDSISPLWISSGKMLSSNMLSACDTVPPTTITMVYLYVKYIFYVRIVVGSLGFIWPASCCCRWYDSDPMKRRSNGAHARIAGLWRRYTWKMYQLFDFAINTRHISHEINGSAPDIGNAFGASNEGERAHSTEYERHTNQSSLIPFFCFQHLFANILRAAIHPFTDFQEFFSSTLCLCSHFSLQPANTKTMWKRMQKGTNIDVNLAAANRVHWISRWPQYVCSATAAGHQNHSILSTFRSSDDVSIKTMVPPTMTLGEIVDKTALS